MKKAITIVLVIIIAATMFCGCSSSSSENTEEPRLRSLYIKDWNSEASQYGWHRLIDIKDQPEFEGGYGIELLHLVYDDVTFIVYYKQAESMYNVCVFPYYSENGYMCRYTVSTGSLEESIH